MPSRDKATLEEIGRAIDWDAQYDRVKNAARGVYKTAAPGTWTWRARGQLVRLPPKLPAWIRGTDERQ